MSMTLFTDEWALISVIDPDENTVASPPGTAVTGDAIDMSDFDQVAFVLAVGNISAAGGTVDFKAEQATTSGGTYKDVTNAAATQLTGSPSDDDKQVIIIVNQEDLDMDNNFRYVRPSVLPAGTTAGTVDACVMCFGRAKHKPGTDLTSVAEIVDA